MSESQKSIVLATTPLWETHHAEAIEIVHRLHAEKKDVVFVTCIGALDSCAANPHKKMNVCRRCVKQSEYTRKNLLPDNVSWLPLEFDEMNFGETYSIQTVDDLMGIFFEDMPIGKLVYSQICDDEKGEYLDIDRLKPKISKLLNNGISLYRQTCELITKKNVSEVYAWNGRRQSDGPALWAARKHSVAYYAYISGGRPHLINIQNSLSVQDFTERHVQLKKVYEKAARVHGMRQVQDEAKAYYKQYREGSVRQVGFRFDSDVNSVKPVLKTDLPILLIVTSTPKEHVHQLQYDEFYGSDPYGRFLEILDCNELYRKFYVIVRWHPFNSRSNTETRERIDRLIDKYGTARHFHPSSKIDTYDLLDKSEVVFATNSTVAQYAASVGKPTIIYGPAAVMFGQSVFAVRNSHEVLKLLLTGDYKNSREPADALKLGFYAGNFGEPFQYVRINTSVRSGWWLRNEQLGTQKPILRPSGFLKRTFRSLKSFVNKQKSLL
ncbi:hypothetical protein SAMN05216526_0825 [Ectothiorhodosinus mongolicus]|uniref:Capsule polysaccharide biosynthesis protein n=1 Tax=Ectothiorhodosinus mongolicus TaxID=233100 RepID=A0A1R3VTV9_9GAMM|nr:hypothetical protein [Ectothiorhodosinus mongolicus]ULX56791.1 hypothetical protein CKX93_03150 [Ectothiorhodosinus mongolicus]SIT68332.1 hypothetical protein SAMN05216526_0825 [Ectothiorhodosinus mongolicus]